MPLIIRYILEFCRTTPEAVQVLQRIPSHMAYNLTVVDKLGQFKTVLLCPGREPLVTAAPITTNHQQRVDWHQHARATATLERERYLYFRLRESDDSAQTLLRSFMHSPVYSTAYERGFGTLYTAVYSPWEGLVDYLWPNGGWRQSFAEFQEGSCAIRFPYRYPAYSLLMH